MSRSKIMYQGSVYFMAKRWGKQNDKKIITFLCFLALYLAKTCGSTFSYSSEKTINENQHHSLKPKLIRKWGEEMKYSSCRNSLENNFIQQIKLKVFQEKQFINVTKYKTLHSCLISHWIHVGILKYPNNHIHWSNFQPKP